MKYRVIYSNRRTMALEIRNGELIVRAPLLATKQRIRAFVEERRDWIEKHLAKSEARRREAEAAGAFTKEELSALAKEAAKVIPERVAHYAPLVGVSYGRITIRAQKTRWGSCSSKGNLSFNCLLMLTPPEVLDSVVVHELCHIKQMNHSPKFYMEVERVYPEYDRWHRWLDEHGGVLLSRLRSSEQ